MINKEFFGVSSAALGLISYAPYFIGMTKGKITPHIFTWLIWTLATGVVFVAQYTAGAGPGAWATGCTCFLCIVIVIFSLKCGTKYVTRSDWAAFLGGLATIPIWYMTSEPLAAVLLITLIDGVAYFPTLRKSVIKPYEEPVLFYGLSNLKHVCSILAIQHYSLTTVLYPSVLIFMNTLLVGVLFRRRMILGKLKIRRIQKRKR